MAYGQKMYGRAKTIVRYVKTQARRRAPAKKKINYPLVALGAGLVAAFVYKDKIKALLNK